MIPTSLRLRAACLTCALAATVLSTSAAPADRAAVSYWAPGVLNRAEGTVELDVTFLANRASMIDDWKFLFRAAGNAPNAGTSILAIVLCPPRDGRGMLALARGTDAATSTSDEVPDFESGSTHRFAITWGQGKFSFWLDGRLRGREAFDSALALLPPKFLAGFDSETGPPASYRIEAVRVSDTARPTAELATEAKLQPDAATTYLYRQDQPLVTGKTAWQTGQFRAGLFPDRGAQKFVTPEGQPLVLPLRGVNFQAKAAAFKLHAQVWNREGKEVAQADSTLDVPAGASYQALEQALPAVKAPGYYRALLAVSSPWGTTDEYEFNYVVQAAEDLQPGKLSGYLGHHHAVFHDIGYNWVRTWASNRVFLWSHLEPSPGKFHWAAADAAVAEAKKDGFQLLAVLGYPPAWASTYTLDEYKKLKRPNKTYSQTPERYKPRSLEEWKNYVRTVVGRYHKDVKYWELYNEVDFHPPAMHATFSGTTAEYFELLKATYEIIKEIDPTCQLLISGFSLTPGITDVNMPKDLLKMGAAPYFDIFNVHGYTDRGTIEDTVAAVRQAKPEVPLWMSEYMYEKPADDYQVTTKAFWFLSQGFVRYVLTWGELDRNFDELNITPFYAVSAEMGRQLKACDAYLGPVPGAAESYASWKLRRSDGSFLYVFAADNGKVRLTFAPTEETPEVLVTGLYGDVLARGPLDRSKPLEFESLVYLTTKSDLTIADSEREYGNVLANGGFEIREGDYIMDEAAARPSSWTLRPGGTPPSAMSFTKGQTGEFALNLKTAGVRAPISSGQVVTLDNPGTWAYSAKVKAPGGAKGTLTVKQNQDGVWREVLVQPFTGTGNWETVSVEGPIQGHHTKAVALVSLDTPDSELAIDEVELVQRKEADAQPAS